MSDFNYEGAQALLDAVLSMHNDDPHATCTIVVDVEPIVAAFLADNELWSEVSCMQEVDPQCVDCSEVEDGASELCRGSVFDRAVV